MHNNYAVITARVLMNKNLTSTQKLLIALISNLSNDRGYCFASNKYLGDCLGLSVSSVRDAINHLEKEKVLIRVVKLKSDLSVEFRSLIIDFNCDFLLETKIPEQENIESNLPPYDTPTDPLRSTVPPPTVECHTPYGRVSHNNKYNNKYNISLSELRSEGHTEATKAKNVTAQTGGEISESEKFAQWFAKNHRIASVPINIPAWASVYDKLIRIDKKTKDEIIKAVEWARKDEFWCKNFLSPMGLRKKNKDGQMYIDVFLDRMKAEKPKQTKPAYSNKPYNPTGAHLNG